MTGVTLKTVAEVGLDAFIRVPYRLYADLPNWIPPLLLERRDALKAGGSPYRDRAEVEMWVAYRDGRPVGRISAQVDPASLARYPGVGHFGMIAAEDDAEVFDRLFEAAEAWLRARGMTAALGPMNLSINQECGLLVHGFDTVPMMMMPHDPPYAAAHIERRGYAKARDLHAFVLDARTLPERMVKVLKRKLSGGATVRPLNWKDYDAEVARLVAIFNDAWADNWGFVPMDEAEVAHLAKELKPLIDRRLVYFAELDGAAFAFIVCLPNLNAAIGDLGGRLLPFGWAKLLWRLKVRGVTSGRVLLMGVTRAMAATGTGRLAPFHLIGKVHEEVLRQGINTIEIGWILEDNKPMLSIADALCGAPYRTNRIFERALG
ncbi:conserved hypothetical protein [uncultured Alphaproteobacteria bacterium]|uniref:N-acetyltransferase domain-containing protein n=1 Tax=uncultured Alphaproteobacteria bacterium TaxID=91750 RepID=A0A212K864_9PROT|nr:conserved hypothetical protein [uncultured Alphaproteobacteria bacterium]